MEIRVGIVELARETWRSRHIELTRQWHDRDGCSRRCRRVPAYDCPEREHGALSRTLELLFEET